MTTKTKNTGKLWSYSAGEWGVNRVRVYERSGSRSIQVECQDRFGHVTRRSLRTKDREEAKRKAEQLAVTIGEIGKGAGAISPDKATLKTLFENYLREKTPDKKPQSRQHDQSALDMFKRFFGEHTKAEELSHQAWNAFIRDRREGKIRPAGSKEKRSVGARTIEYDLKLLKAVYRWGETYTLKGGHNILSKNPISKFPMPSEKNPVRPRMSAADYASMLQGADKVGVVAKTLLILANETGHRINAILNLKWDDLNLDEGSASACWRGDADKSGRTHHCPLSENAVNALKAYKEGTEFNEVWVFSSPKDPENHMHTNHTKKIWKRIEAAANLEHIKGKGWHSLRRKFATDLIEQPVAVVAALGGWKTANLLISVYQKPDHDHMATALKNRKAS